MECSRLEELKGNVPLAREILHHARKATAQDWKVFLESVMLELRAGNVQRAVQRAEEALEVHPGTGRLWAVRACMRAQPVASLALTARLDACNRRWCSCATCAARSGSWTCSSTR